MEAIDNNESLEKAIFFVDASNFHFGMKKFGFLPNNNYARFSQKLARQNGLRWIETRFYTGQFREQDDQRGYGKQKEFLERLERADPRIKILRGRIEERPTRGTAQALTRWLNGFHNHPLCNQTPPALIDELRQVARERRFHRHEKAVDVMLATDMVSMAYESKYDVAFLLSADGDYEPAIKKVKETGRKVYAASAIYGSVVARSVDHFVTLDEKFFSDCRRYMI
jgi:uncharacterized LabA/DUF88 family protein